MVRGSRPGSPGSRRQTSAAQVTGILFEACEKRLVLSAQLLFDGLADQAIDPHAAAPGGATTGAPTPGETPGLETFLQQAHSATGLDVVHEQFGLTGSGQTVAVIDTGIAWDHVALGNGYGPGYRVVGGWDFTEENDAQPYDDGPAGFHGTHVSGIIGSDDPSNLGIAPEVDLVALRVFNDSGEGQLAWVESALEWVHQNRETFENPITTVNISIGTLWNSNDLPEWASLEDELQQLRDDGILVTASAGNSFQDFQAVGLSYPASSQFVLPVASVDNSGELSDFSQRSDRVLAAPGSNIVSTIPDHVLGRDGNIDDFGTASGTSMASPYVAGASVLVREAMMMTGWETINADTISDHLFSTADTIFDSVTGMNYDRLNLEAAIQSLLPVDGIGDEVGSASDISLTESTLDTWINHLTDTDVYRFTADSYGNLSVDAESAWVESLQWSIWSGGQELTVGDLDPQTLELVAGQSYELHVSASSDIGPLSFDLGFEETAPPPTPEPEPPAATLEDLGTVRYQERAAEAGSGFAVTASQSGIFTVQWANPDAAAGALVVERADGSTEAVDEWSNGALRLDLQVDDGELLNIYLPGATGDQGDLVLANALEQTGTSATLTGSLGRDQIAMDMQHGLRLSLGSVEYTFATDEIDSLTLDGHGSNDSLTVIGSEHLDRVNLRPDGSSIDNDQIEIVIGSIEEISYESGGGADRVYLYDSDTDDTLTARPGQAELVGVGYRFDVTDVDRIFIHATGGGQDYAYLYDSEGDDRLSVRPQFTSISGDDFFNYVRGFERVYAYANAGGTDTANLYDSEANDRFTTSGVSASIVGPGFSSFTRSFELVNAHAGAGGEDLATLYGSDQQTEWQQGSDFISFRESSWQREARGFNTVETYEAATPITVSSESPMVSALATAPAPTTASLLAAAVSAESDLATMQFGGEPIESVPALAAWQFDSADTGNSLDEPELLGGELNDDELVAELLRDSVSIQQMLAHKLYLPEERLIDDPQLERDTLDEAFRQFEASFES